MVKSTLNKIQRIEPDTLLTSYQVGAVLQVNPSSINKWVKDGRIQAFRTPGGHRRIRATDLVTFLEKHEMPIPRPLSNAARRRLMIVDDDSKQLEALQRLLKGQHQRVEVLLVDSGIDALLQVGSFRPDVVLLDVFMPGLDGVEVCKRMTKLRHTQNVKVILTTAKTDDELAERGKKAGAFKVVPKPLDAKVVLDALGIVEDGVFAY